jgi:DNA-binding MarR family transcriptional regulator
VHANADDPAAGDVEELTSAVLAASRLLLDVSIRSLAATDEKVTLAQFRMLVLLATHGESKLVTLAEHLMVNPSTALRMVERLMEGGFISRRVNPASRREVLMQLTPVGQRIVREVTARRRDEIAAIITRLSPRDRAALVRALRTFAQAGREAPDGERDLSQLGWD